MPVKLYKLKFIILLIILIKFYKTGLAFGKYIVLN